MGMSASQARLLSLTARMSDLELKMQNISNSKIRLAEQSESVALAYSDALNKQKLTVSDGNSNYIDATAYNLTNYNAIYEMDKQRFLKDSYGRVLITDEIADSYKSANGNLDTFLVDLLGYPADGIITTTSQHTETIQVPHTQTVQTGVSINYNDSTIINSANLQSTYNANIAITGETKKHPDADTAIVALKQNITSIGNALGTAIKNSLLPAIGSDKESVLNAALEYAKTATYNKFVYNKADGTAGDTVSIASYKDGESGDGCEGSNSLIWCYRKHKIHPWAKEGEKFGKVFVDGKQLIDTFLTFFDKYCQQQLGGTCTSNVGAGSTKRGASGGTGTTNGPIYETQTTYTTEEIVVTDVIQTKAEDYDTAAVQYYTNIFNEVQANGYITTSDENMNSPEWLYAQLNNGNLHLSEWDEKAGANGLGGFVDIPWKTGDNSLQVKNDDTGIAKAEAQYDAAMASIQSKDKRFDLELKNIDTEHEAITQEVDTVKKVISNNIKSSFKIFEA